MKIIVCGGRHYADVAKVYSVLDELHSVRGIDCLVHGAAAGADHLASQWATECGIPQKPYRAMWERYGHHAGPRRNYDMLAEMPDMVVAFPGSKSTAHMVKIAKKAGVDVYEAK